MFLTTTNFPVNEAIYAYYPFLLTIVLFAFVIAIIKIIFSGKWLELIAAVLCVGFAVYFLLSPSKLEGLGEKTYDIGMEILYKIKDGKVKIDKEDKKELKPDTKEDQVLVRVKKNILEYKK